MCEGTRIGSDPAHARLRLRLQERPVLRWQFLGADQYFLADIVDDAGDEIAAARSGHNWEDQVLVSEAFDLRLTP